MITVSLQGGFVGVTPLERFNWMKSAVAWADEVGPLVRTALKAQAPVGEGANAGRLRNSIRYERRTRSTLVQLRFGSGVPYAKYVVRGTKAHPIYPVAARALRFMGSGGVVFAKGVKHPGTRPNDFPRRALRVTRSSLETTLGSHMRELGG